MQSKKDKEREIYNRLMEVYDAASGSKAAELLKKAQAFVAFQEEGQSKAEEMRQKAETKLGNVIQMRDQQMSDLRDQNDKRINTVLEANDEICEKQKYDSLNKVIVMDKRAKTHMRTW